MTMNSSGVWVFEYVSGGGLGRVLAGANGAALLAAGRAMRDALVQDLSSLPDVALRWASGAGDGAPRDDESIADFVRREAARQRWCWVVAPECEGVLAALASAVAPRAWIGCTQAAIVLCASKRATLVRLAACGLATPLAFERPPTCGDASGPPRGTRKSASGLAFPCEPEATRWIVKPDDGAGTVDTRRHDTRDRADADLAARRARGASATLEPWVDGEALSLALLCGPHGAELLAINRQRIAIDAEGRLHDEGVAIRQMALDDPRAAPLAELARAVHGAIDGLRGFVGIDVVWHATHGPVAIEVNPRLTSAYVGLSAALGRNLAAEILALHEEVNDVAA